MIFGQHGANDFPNVSTKPTETVDIRSLYQETANGQVKKNQIKTKNYIGFCVN